MTMPMPDDDSEDDYDKVDRDALQRAVNVRYVSVKGKIELLEALAARSRREVAERAAYSCQIKALKLRPWESPPCWGAGFHSTPQAAQLLDRLLAAGLSMWEPDPIAALAKAEAKRK